MVNPTWLKTYITLVEVGHFTRTAEKLAMTQPGVTQHVHKLEAYFECELLRRIGKRFELTDEGRRVYDFALHQLARERQLRRLLAVDAPDVGLCRVASPGAAALRLYPYFLDCQQQSKKLVIQLEVAPNQRITQLIEKRQIDLGFVTNSLQQANLSTQVIGQEPLCLVVPENVQEVDWQVLMRLGFINHPDGFYHARLVLGSNFEEYSSSEQLPISGYVNQLSQILQPISRGLGFTVLPMSAVGGVAGVRVVKLSRQVTEQLYAVYHADQPLAQRYQRLLNGVLELYDLAKAS